MGEQPKLSNKIRELRARFNLTQEDLGNKVGVTRQTIISIEKGEYVPSLVLGMRIAGTLKTTVEQLFTVHL